MVMKETILLKKDNLKEIPRKSLLKINKHKMRKRDYWKA